MTAKEVKFAEWAVERAGLIWNPVKQVWLTCSKNGFITKTTPELWAEWEKGEFYFESLNDNLDKPIEL